MASPLERSKELLESQGFHVWKVERPASMYQPTLDLFNFGDLLAIRGDRVGSTAIQCCGEDITPHIHKILDGYTIEKIKKNKETKASEIITTVIPPNPYLKTWLEAKNLFFVWGWRLRKNEGTRDKYQLREVEFVLKDGHVVSQEVPS